MRRAPRRSSSRATSVRWRRWSQNARLRRYRPCERRASRTGYPHPGSSAGRGAGDDSFCNARRSEDLSRAVRAHDCPAGKRHGQPGSCPRCVVAIGIEPSEEDVMETIGAMAPGRREEPLRSLACDPAQLEALSIAVMRFAAITPCRYGDRRVATAFLF